VDAVRVGACCAPIVDQPVDAAAAADVARGFKALGDPFGCACSR
jgi:hypothetical protein